MPFFFLSTAFSVVRGKNEPELSDREVAVCASCGPVYRLACSTGKTLERSVLFVTAWRVLSF